MSMHSRDRDSRDRDGKDKSDGKDRDTGHAHGAAGLVPKSAKEKLKAIHAAVGAIEKQFGKGAIMPLGGTVVTEVAVVPTGSLALDVALGVGGLPRGRIIEIFGPESSGKTTLTLHAIAEAQRAGGVCAFIDAEHALDTGYARRLGVNLEDLLVSQPDCGEQALEITDTLVRTGAIDLIVVDSVAALTPRAEIEGDMGDSHMGLQARLMSQALRKLTAVTARSGTAIIFINQLRQKIGIVYGNPETTTGGNALKFYASVRLDIRRTGVVKTGDESVGSKARVKVVKNKVAPPFREAEFEILYGVGVNKPGEIVDLGEKSGLLEKSGNWFAYKGKNLANGRDKMITYLGENPAVAQEIRASLVENARAECAMAPAAGSAAGTALAALTGAAVATAAAANGTSGTNGAANGHGAHHAA